MSIPTEVVLEKVAQELENADEVLTAQDTLTRVTFAAKALDKVKQNQNQNFEKTAAISRASLGEIGGTLAKALVAGIGIGLAGEVISAGHEKIKDVLFHKKMDELVKQIKKVNPELKNTPDKEIKQMLNAGYKLAPEVMEDPILAASFVSIGKSLGGKIDPNTMKTIAETGAKARSRRNLFLEALPGASQVI